MNRKKIDFKLALLKRYPVCEVCGWRTATDIGHCLYHPYKERGGFDPLYTCFENCQSNCNTCNVGYGSNANSRATKQKHWAKRKAEGYDMDGWNAKIPAHRREGFE
jgi:hypothetical protein